MFKPTDCVENQWIHQNLFCLTEVLWNYERKEIIITKSLTEKSFNEGHVILD